MDNIDIELRKVIDAAIQSSVNIDEVKSLKELYISKRNSLKLSDRQIQKMLGMDAKTLNPILNGEAKQINFVNVIKLAHFLGISVNDLIKVYVPDLDSKQIGDIQRAREAGYIVEYFDVSILNKIKFFKSGSSSYEMAEKIKTFFNIETLYNYSEDSLQSAFSRTKRNSNDLMRNFWVKSAFVQFETIANPYNYDRKELIDLIPKIRPHTRDIENGLIKVLKALYRVGVTVLFQPSVEKLQVRGATMVVNSKPCIVLSDLQNNYPTLWFTLLHELHHVLYDIEEIEKRTYHISSGEGDLFLMNEEKADSFAQEYLLNESRLKFASGYISSPLSIEKLAKEWGVHSSIIYSIYCYKTSEWAFYNKYIPKMDSALQLLNTHPFERETLIESAKQIKKIIAI
ncbi:XRE family transcriptional regulator [Bacteroides sp. 224]|uniref:XRE family transcriptional regulator n=1 Tax=Bacteroides sp. 224 TaxID=2302936 RepID=UPI0013D25E82|nr:XRE family transcriptional regulator [Bacteroides sp. 224]NDV64474.1 helix-turn-helix domain-containing protein [Bacteroides sp. 224]